jgi:hypothetical protein
MTDRDLQELRGDLHDLTDTIGGLGVELEALNMSTRALTAHLTGEDPLKDSLYFGDEGGDGDLQPPPWVNQPTATTRSTTGDEEPADPLQQIKNAASEATEGNPPPSRGNIAFPTGLVVLAALGGSLGAILLLLWAIGG